MGIYVMEYARMWMPHLHCDNDADADSCRTRGSTGMPLPAVPAASPAACAAAATTARPLRITLVTAAAAAAAAEALPPPPNTCCTWLPPAEAPCA